MGLSGSILILSISKNRVFKLDCVVFM